jgi:tRNA A37 threonylcarbamoyladenosine biosynthesis protein TsaE
VQHLDLYRLERPDEVWELGWSELGAPGDLVLIEWPGRAEALLPEPRWEVEIEELGDPAARRVAIRRVGDPPPLPPMRGDAP